MASRPYTERDEEIRARAGTEPKSDSERDRRLLPEEERAIRALLRGDERTSIIVPETVARIR